MRSRDDDKGDSDGDDNGESVMYVRTSVRTNKFLFRLRHAIYFMLKFDAFYVQYVKTGNLEAKKKKNTEGYVQLDRWHRLFDLLTLHESLMELESNAAALT